jgi:DNA-binding transcriptional ArsR family regulator
MTDIYMLRELGQIRAIADPLRIRILDVLCHNSMTTKQVAEFLGENVNKLYHHVDTLEAAGLIKLVDTRKNRGTLEKYFQAVAKHFTLSPVLFEVQLDASEERSELTFSAALQATLTEIKQSMAKKLIKPNSSQHFFTRFHVRTTKAKAKELEEKFQAWVKECEDADSEGGNVVYGLTATLYPVEEKTAQPEKTSTEKKETKSKSKRAL